MPLLPTGQVPPGFLGYAVNLINIDVHCIDTRTNRGHGLRETLFYLLFGELQVYETRESMKGACSCIKHGAVSLDGGIMKGNGVLSLGIGYVIMLCLIISEVFTYVEIYLLLCTLHCHEMKYEHTC